MLLQDPFCWISLDSRRSSWFQNELPWYFACFYLFVEGDIKNYLDSIEGNIGLDIPNRCGNAFVGFSEIISVEISQTGCPIRADSFVSLSQCFNFALLSLCEELISVTKQGWRNGLSKHNIRWLNRWIHTLFSISLNREMKDWCSDCISIFSCSCILFISLKTCWRATATTLSWMGRATMLSFA